MRATVRAKMTTRSSISFAVLLMLGCAVDERPEPEPDPATTSRPGDGDGAGEPRPDLPTGDGDGNPGDGDGDGAPVGPGVCQSGEDPAKLKQVASIAGCEEPNQWLCSLGEFAPEPVATVCCDLAPPYCIMVAPAGDCPVTHWAACEV